MLNIELVTSDNVTRAATVFHRDGFVAIGEALSPEELERAQVGAQRVIENQTAAAPPGQGNRGFARYSFGDQIHHPEWAMLVDLPTVLPIIESIWKSQDYTCTGAGGDYSLPGAKIQPLHSDMGDFFQDPLGQTDFRDVPAPFIVVNFLMTAFTKENGAIRFVPGTQRSHHAIPPLDEEPVWMKDSIVCAPAGTAIIRDVRCWHGGASNQSTEIRPMTSVGYYAPWFRAREEALLPKEVYKGLAERGKALCKRLVREE